MTALTDAAAAAYAAQEAAQETTREDARRALRLAATEALRAVLVKPDGTSMTLAEVGLTSVFSDPFAGWVVWSDGTVFLAARKRDDREVWRIFLVRKNGGLWENVAGPLRSLADLGAALKGGS